MNTELFITTPRLGTVTVDGTTAIVGVGTDFTAGDVGKSIIIRTTAGDKRGVVATFTDAENITVAVAIDTTQSLCYYYIDYYNADLYDDFPYSLNYAIADIRNPESRNASFSKTIKLPGSKANNIIFDNIFQIDLYGSFNPNIRAFIIIYSNYVPVFNGNLQLLRINRDGDKIEYEVSVFGKIGDLFQKIADKLVTDLDLSDLDELGTATNITDSWATPTDLFYPLLDNGRQVFNTSSPSYVSDQITPAIRVSRVFETILSSVGYSCSTTSALYTATGMDKLYIPCLKDWRRKCYYAGQIKVDYGAGIDQIFLTLSVDRIRQGITEVIESIFYQKTGAAITTITEFQNHEIELDYGDIIYVTIENVISNGFTIKSGADTFFTIQTLDNQYNYNSPISFQTGVTTDYIIPTSTFASARITFDNVTTGGNYDLYNTWNETIYEGLIPIKYSQGYLPDNYKQRDFLLALIKMFNLYLEPVFDNDTQISILPRDTYYQNLNVVDWTDKIDVGQNIELVPMGELDWKEYLFSWKPDSDFWNNDYKAKTFEIYGQRNVIVENDFIATKKKIEVEVAPTPLIGSDYHTIVLPTCIKDGVNTIPNIYSGVMRVLYYDSSQLVGTGSGYFILDGVNKYSYPFSGHLVGSPQTPTFDYNWASPRSLYYTMSDPSIYPYSENLYTSFWQNFILEISDQYSKIFIAYFNLTSEDVRELDFSAKYFIDGTYFRLNKVIDYNPIGNQLTKCELIRINDAVYAAQVVSNGDTQVGTGSDSFPPNMSAVLADAQIIVGDSFGNAQPRTMSGDANIDSSARVDVVGLRGRDIQDAAPSNGDVYQWVAANSRWEPTAGGGGGTPGGSNKQVQYNDGGAFGAEAGFEYDKATNELTVPDLIDSSLTASQIVLTNASKKLVSSLTLPNNTLATTQAAADNSTKVATTAYVDTADALKAPLVSPTFTGTVTTPAIIVSSETASRVAIIDASKNIKSADTATYPDLTELSYLKGVTSAIQTQLNAKQATISLTTTGTSGAATFAANVLNVPIYSTGTAIVLDKTVTDVSVNATAETKVYSYTVPANTLASGDILDLIARFRKTGTVGTMITRIRFGTNNSTADTIMATMTSATATLTQNMERTWIIKDATHIEVYTPTSNVNTDVTSSGNAITSVTVNLTVINYIVITIQDASAVDTGIFSAFYVRKN